MGQRRHAGVQADADVENRLLDQAHRVFDRAVGLGHERRGDAVRAGRHGNRRRDQRTGVALVERVDGEGVHAPAVDRDLQLLPL